MTNVTFTRVDIGLDFCLNNGMKTTTQAKNLQPGDTIVVPNSNGEIRTVTKIYRESDDPKFLDIIGASLWVHVTTDEPFATGKARNTNLFAVSQYRTITMVEGV